MSDLFTRSIEVIKENQHSSGAYLASPNFSTYRYCWYRDGSFIAYAMNPIGENESAARFHDWASSNVLSRVDIIQRALNKKLRNEILPSEEGLHTRYTLEGLDAEQDWPNFQLDGFGTWLWSLGEYQKLSGATLKPTWVEAAQWTAKYLSALWRQPCSDCWEEFPDQIHLNTLGSIYG